MEGIVHFDKKARISFRARRAEHKRRFGGSATEEVRHQVAIEMLQAFVSHRGEKHIPAMFNALEIFIRKTAPIIEDMHQRLKLRNAKIYKDVTGDLIRRSLRAELKDAQRGLYHYQIIHNVLQNRLSMLSSHFSMPDYLQENYGISRESSRFYSADLELLWASTYGLLIDRIRLIISKIEEMHLLLVKQIAMYNKLGSPHIFIESIATEEGIHIEFQKERDAFREVVNLTKLSSHEIAQIQKIFFAQMFHLKQTLVTYVNIVRSGIDKQYPEEASALEKALVAAVFLVKLAAICLNIKKNVLRKTSRLGTRVIERKLTIFSEKSKDLLLAINVDPKAFLRNAGHLLKMIESLPEFA